MNPFLKNRSPFFWVLILGVGLIAVMLILTPERKETNPEQLPWNAKILPNHKVQALGLTLTETTLEEAMKLYGKDVEIRLFSNKDETEKSLEAYFPVIYIDSIKAALLLKLKTDEATLNGFYDRGIETTVTATGQRQVKISGKDIVKTLKLPIETATLIPRKNLSYRALKIRFGEPAKIVHEKNIQIERWYYPQYALEIIYDPEGPEALQYASQFANLMDNSNQQQP